MLFIFIETNIYIIIFIHIIMQESPPMMVIHGAIIAGILYLVMVYALQQLHNVALSRSILIGLLSAAYMILFGHGAPTKLNPDLGF